MKLHQRNTDVLRRIKEVKRRNPKWKFSCVLEDVANEFYISVDTVKRIIREDAPPQKPPPQLAMFS